MDLAGKNDTVVFVLNDEGNLQCLRLGENESCIDYRYNYVQDLSFFDSSSAEKVWTYGKQCLKNGCDLRAAIQEKDVLQIA